MCVFSIALSGAFLMEPLPTALNSGTFSHVKTLMENVINIYFGVKHFKYHA